MRSVKVCGVLPASIYLPKLSYIAPHMGEIKNRMLSKFFFYHAFRNGKKETLSHSGKTQDVMLNVLIQVVPLHLSVRLIQDVPSSWLEKVVSVMLWAPLTPRVVLHMTTSKLWMSWNCAPPPYSSWLECNYPTSISCILRVNSDCSSFVPSCL